MQDAADLEDRLRRLLHAVPGGDDLFRFRPVQVGAAVGHQAIVGLLQRHLRVPPRDDGVVAHAGRDGQLGGGADERIGVAQVVDGIGHAWLASCGAVVPGQVLEHITEPRQHGHRQPHQAAQEATQPAPGQRRATHGCGDEDGPVHLRQWRKIQQRLQPLAHPLAPCGIQLAPGHEPVPEPIPRRTHQQPADHPAHAVADQGHLARGARGRLWIEVLQGLFHQRLDLRAVDRDGHVGGVVDLPDLVLLAQQLVAHDLVGHVHPCLGTAAQAVQHQHDAPVGVVALHQVQVRALDAVLAAQHRAQRLPGEPGLGQP